MYEEHVKGNFIFSIFVKTDNTATLNKPTECKLLYDVEATQDGFRGQ